MIQIYTSVKTIRQILSVLVLFFAPASEINAQVKISFVQVINSTTPTGGAVTTPIDIVNSGDQTNRLFVVQQAGIIKAYTQNPIAYLGDFLTVTGINSGGEQGLLSMSFHPDYKNNGYFFVYYNNSNGDVEIARYHTPTGTPNTADPASKKILLTIPHPGETNHNGGKLNFGPDGFLYFATGDGGGGGDVPNNAQNGTVLLGKMIRIDVNSEVAPYYTIPADNPFLAAGDNIRDEIWAFGLRNPFRWSFDKSTHDMWIGDVGQDLYEEINFRANGTTGGINYGWHCKEGSHDYNGGCALVAGTGTYAPPLLDFSHDLVTGGRAVIGGYVYRGTQQPMIGYYIFADEQTGNVWLLPPGGAAADTIHSPTKFTLISAFGEGEDGELFATTLNGQVHHITATVDAALPVKLISFSGTAKTGYNDLNWQTTDEVQLKQFEIEYSTDGINFEQAGIVAAANSSNYHFSHTINNSAKKIFYRLKMVDFDGKAAYSKTIILSMLNAAGKNFVTPSIVTNGSITVSLGDNYTGLQIVNMDGKMIHTESLNNRTGKINVQMPSARPGQYLVRLIGNGKIATQKIVVQ